MNYYAPDYIIGQSIMKCNDSHELYGTWNWNYETHQKATAFF